jgi:hypothetical protein
MRVWIFNHPTYEFLSNFSTIYGIIFPALKVWIRGCIFRIEISYHYEVVLVDKFLLLKIELTV